ncbi:scgn [Symbiodinium pilosum]|uniref:Scgn protein n=1 Tax=Symbiodinium pilosum TaxID=2952 RepID=A0A812N2U1_SYMPI|nr:scgn [Symbiodinium pilosum]
MPVGNVAAIVGARRASKQRNHGYRPTPVSSAEQRRQEAAWQEYKRKVKLNKIIKAYDTNKTGKLERSQVVKLLTDIDSSTPPGTPPSEDQVDFLLKCYDKAGDESINASELEELLSCWSTYTENRQMFESKLEKYDISKTGKLSKEELKAYLTDLNGGLEVEDAEVDWVMSHADVMGDGELNRMELARATSLWYAFVEKKNQNSQCCTVL